MARIVGKIGSLKTLKAELNDAGIHQFKSVKEINNFISTFQFQKDKIIEDAKNDLHNFFIQTCESLDKKVKYKEVLIKEVENLVDQKIEKLEVRIDSILKVPSSSIFKRLFNSIKLQILNRQLSQLQKTKPKKVNSATQDISREISIKEKFIHSYKSDKELLLEKKIRSKIDELEYTRRIINKHRSLISGAIGENLVSKEIKKLSNDYVLINDVNLRFSPPIYNKKSNERIYTVQIDHLLISTKGIFIIETKNWSQASIDSLDLRSPVEQIKRANFGLYVYLNNRITLYGHHWGEQKLPIRNVIVMIHKKPKYEFKFVAIKSLKELNRYLNYFDPVLNKGQVDRIVEILN